MFGICIDESMIKALIYAKETFHDLTFGRIEVTKKISSEQCCFRDWTILSADQRLL